MITRRATATLLSLLLTSPAWAQAPASAGSAPSAQPPPQLESQTLVPDPAALPSFGSLFRDLGRDVRRLPSRETAAILGAAGAISLGVRDKDVMLTRQVSGSPALDTVFEPGAVLGGGEVQIGAALGTYVVGRLARSPRASIVGADLVRAQILNTVLTQGIKLSVGRRRPDGTRYSFPSGHSSSTFATAAVLQRHLGWKAGLPAYGLAAFVAGSRLQENRHFLSDVIFGGAIGVIAGRAVTVGRGKATFAVTPIATTAGGGIGLTLVGAQ